MSSHLLPGPTAPLLCLSLFEKLPGANILSDDPLPKGNGLPRSSSLFSNPSPKASPFLSGGGSPSWLRESQASSLGVVSHMAMSDGPGYSPGSS